MKDKDLLIWVHGRLAELHGEDPRVDYMRKLLAIAAATDPEQCTPNVTNEQDVITCKHREKVYY